MNSCRLVRRRIVNIFKYKEIKPNVTDPKSEQELPPDDTKIQGEFNQEIKSVSIEEVNEAPVKYKDHPAENEEEMPFKAHTEYFNYRIIGKEFQSIEIDLYKNQTVRALTGSLAYMTEGVRMNTEMTKDLESAFSRTISGGTLFMTDFTYSCEDDGFGRIVLSPSFPSRILPLRLSE